MAVQATASEGNTGIKSASIVSRVKFEGSFYKRNNTYIDATPDLIWMQR